MHHDDWYNVQVHLHDDVCCIKPSGGGGGGGHCITTAEKKSSSGGVMVVEVCSSSIKQPTNRSGVFKRFPLCKLRVRFWPGPGIFVCLRSLLPFFTLPAMPSHAKPVTKTKNKKKKTRTAKLVPPVTFSCSGQKSRCSNNPDYITSTEEIERSSKPFRTSYCLGCGDFAVPAFPQQ